MRDVRRGQRRKRNMSLYYGTVLLIALVIFAILSVTVFFRTETVIITGSSVYSIDEIISASGIEGGENMIRKNMGKAEERITSELVYIETAHISRKLPSSVEISVTPCVESACMQYDEGWFIVSAKGKVLRTAESPPEGMIIFYGTEPAEDIGIGSTFASAEENKTEVIYELLEKRLSGGFAEKMTSFDVTSRVNISCMYEDRINIELGAISDLDYKFRFAEEIITLYLEDNAEGRLRMLENGAQFMSNSDLEQIMEFRRAQEEAAEQALTEPAETDAEPSEDTSASTKLNFE
ncbi:MAG: FtsQ-type POTRA domain-containing protein [Oscillospiraceae bacterium]|nr:FtsQ-type POTRA domain-containing protein [Oscillospiraceae bacterium]